MKTSNSKALQKIITDNKGAWWWMSDKNRKKLSLGSIVEGVLNYGYRDDVMRLFDIVGIRRVSDIFYHDMSDKRTRGNYFPIIRNFFDLYFKKYALGNTHKKTK